MTTDRADVDIESETAALWQRVRASPDAEPHPMSALGNELRMLIRQSNNRFALVALLRECGAHLHVQATHDPSADSEALFDLVARIDASIGKEGA